jgi:hypothetical protein
MDKIAIATRLVKLAGMIVADWSPVRRDVDVTQRNREVLDSLTTFAPGLGREMRKRMALSLNHDGYDVRPDGLNREWSKYLTYIDWEENNNKYHYYAVYSFAGPDGQTLYVGANCSGRIGIVERAYDLTKKFMRGPTDSLQQAIRAVEMHMREKIGKGYRPVHMTRG